MPIKESLLNRVDGAETALFRAGYVDFRVRVRRDGGALVQLTGAQTPGDAARAAGLLALIAPWFPDARIDEAPRISGENA